MNDSWQLNRMGLINFWYFTNEVFNFSDGHMLIRGSNGSGKSVILQSIIPLLLDGNYSSRRIDPFGGKDRKLEDYLLDEGGKFDSRIGYLYLEFKKPNLDRYITIGMGINARRNSKIDTFYFVILDNSRVNIDLQLMDKQKALTKQELKNRVGKEQFFDTQKAYIQQVNNVIFGFENIEEYIDTLDLLLKLRMPKLSDNYKPTVLSELLTTSLKALSDDDLRFMTEAITSMDETNDQLQSLNASLKAAQIIKNEYDKYNCAILNQKFLDYTDTKQSLDSQSKLVDTINKTIDTNQNDLIFHKEKEKELIAIQTSLKEKYLSLSNSDALNLFEEISRLREEIKKLQVQGEHFLKRYNRSNDNLIDLKSKILKQNDLYFLKKESIDEIFDNLDDIYTQWPFSEHLNLKHNLSLEDSFDFSYISTQIDNMISLVHELKIKIAIIESQSKTIDLTKNHISILESKIEQQDQKILKIEKQYLNEIQSYQDHFIEQNQKNKFLKVDQSEIKKIIKSLIDYEINLDYSLILQPIINLKDSILNQNYRDLVRLEIELKEIQNQYSINQRELIEWQNKADITPKLDQLVLNNRLDLKMKGVDYVGLYKLLDFDKDLSEQRQNQFEAMLLQTNLINAVVINQNDRKQVLENLKDNNDLYVFTNMDVKKIEPFIINEDTQLSDVFDYLGCSLEQSQFLKSSFKFGIIEGIVSSKQKAQYVGEHSRKQYQKMQIAKFQEMVNELKFEIEKKESEILNLKNSSEIIEEEYRLYWSSSKLDNLLKLIKNESEERKQIEILKEKVYEDLKRYEHELKTHRLKLNEIASLLSIENTLDSYDQIEQYVIQYQKHFNQLRLEHYDYIHLNREIERLNENLVENELQHDHLKIDLENILDQQNQVKISIDTKQIQLDSLGYQSLIETLQETKDELTQIEVELKDCQEKKIRSDNDLYHNQNKKIELKRDLELISTKCTLKFEMLKKEADLNFVVDSNWQIEDLKKLEKSKLSLAELAKSLTEQIQLKKNFLEEYRIENEMKKVDENDEQPRLFILARYASQTIGIDQLVKKLEHDCEIHSQLLLDADRHLFEDILINTLAKKVRSNIQDSLRWIERINSYMSEMQTSSGLRLTVKWKPKMSHDPEQLNTRELVDLLSSDELLLTQADKEKISSHFRSKILKARELTSEDGYSSFHEIMKNIMDYRQWFTFVILYDKDQKIKKELTNRDFGTFSGGEKAMTMYIPLLAAIGARFSNASDQAPFIIALDEAFAGVDDYNVNNMFALISKFNFNYIMNSQILWGDYQSVKSLAIYELHRNTNKNYITVMAYHWNGHVKEYVEHNDYGTRIS